MPGTLFYNASVVLHDQLAEEATVSVSDGKIETVNSPVEFVASESVDCSGLTLMPGFIDAHIHGADGVDVNTADVDGLLKIARFLARHGVTAWLPTLVPDSDENYRRTISNIDVLMDIQADKPIAQAVGIHYEGVFANEKMCGALRPEFFKTFSGKQLGELPTLNRGVHMTTFAPEVEGGIELAEELKRQGWVAAIGHTRADIETLDRAFDAGARHVTHFFNAMTPMHHRDVGVVGWGLSKPGVTFDIIADGIHVHPSMLEFACRTRTPSDVSLISDSVAPTGLGDGEFEIWGEMVRVAEGRTQNERGSIAGSVITMREAVTRMLALGFTPAEVSRMASMNPARLLGLESARGSIEIGKQADIVAVDSNGDVRLTMVAGRIIFDNR